MLVIFNRFTKSDLQQETRRQLGGVHKNEQITNQQFFGLSKTIDRIENHSSNNNSKTCQVSTEQNKNTVLR